MTQISTHELRLERTIPAPLSQVRNAFLDRSIVAKWFAPGPLDATVRTYDAKVGGRYHVDMTGPNAGGKIETHSMAGSFKEISPSRIVMSMNWEGDEPAEATVCTWSFQEKDGGTFVSLVQTGLPSAEDVTNHTQGWEGCLDKLPNAI